MAAPAVLAFLKKVAAAKLAAKMSSRGGKKGGAFDFFRDDEQQAVVAEGGARPPSQVVQPQANAIGPGRPRGDFLADRVGDLGSSGVGKPDLPPPIAYTGSPRQSRDDLFRTLQQDQPNPWIGAVLGPRLGKAYMTTGTQRNQKAITDFMVERLRDENLPENKRQSYMDALTGARTSRQNYPSTLSKIVDGRKQLMVLDPNARPGTPLDDRYQPYGEPSPNRVGQSIAAAPQSRSVFQGHENGVPTVREEFLDPAETRATGGDPIYRFRDDVPAQPYSPTEKRPVYDSSGMVLDLYPTEAGFKPMPGSEPRDPNAGDPASRLNRMQMLRKRETERLLAAKGWGKSHGFYLHQKKGGGIVTAEEIQEVQREAYGNVAARMQREIEGQVAARFASQSKPILDADGNQTPEFRAALAIQMVKDGIMSIPGAQGP